MASVNELFDEMKDEKQNQKPKGKWQPSLEGEYVGHITEVATRVVEFKNYKARVYNFKFIVAPENSENQYTKDYIKGEASKVNGGEYVGRVFRSIGIFRFLEPGADDTFESNSSGNKNYLSLCSAVGKTPKLVTQSIDGKEIEVKELPNLSESDLVGMPVKAGIRKGKEYQDKNGYKRNYLDVKWVNPWPEGTKKEVSADDEIPF